MTPVEVVVSRPGGSLGALDDHARGLRRTSGVLARLLCMDAVEFTAEIVAASAMLRGGEWLTDWDEVRRRLHDRAGFPGRWG